MSSAEYVEITTPTQFETPSLLHKIHVQPFLTEEESKNCLNIADKYANESLCWEKPSDRHVSYRTVDFEVEDCQELSSYLGELNFFNRITERMGEAYDLDPRDLECLDFFCAQYEAKKKDGDDDDDKGDEEVKLTMDHLEYHRDESLLSFTVLLSDPSSFEGGGTIFDCLHLDSDEDQHQYPDVVHRTTQGGVIRPKTQGNCVLHSGKMLHGADKITSGLRTVFVGFVEVAPYVQASGVLGEACKEWGRMDVAKLRAEYQNKKKKEVDSTEEKHGWKTNNKRWLPHLGGKNSSLLCFSPFFSSVLKRNEEEYQRKHRLLTEDFFLHHALLPKDERQGSRENLFGGDFADITILEPID